MSTRSTWSDGWGPAAKSIAPSAPVREFARIAECAVNFVAALALVVLMAAAGAEGGTQSKSPDDAAPDRPEQGGGNGTLAAPGKEWLIAAYSGSPYTYPSDVKITKPGVHDFTAKDVDWQGLPFVNPIYYGVRIARWFEGGRFGSMLDFTHSKAISIRDEKIQYEGTYDGKPAPETALVRDVFRKLEASHGHNMLTLNGLMRLPSFSLRLSPYVGAGAGVSLPHSEVHVIGEPSRTYEYQIAGPVAQALIGIEIRLPRTSVFFEYKFTFADYRMPLTGRDGSILPVDLWRQFSAWWSGTEPPGGWAETRFTSHEIIGGFGMRIAPAP